MCCRNKFPLYDQMLNQIGDSSVDVTPNYLAFLSQFSPLNAAKTFLK